MPSLSITHAYFLCFGNFLPIEPVYQCRFPCTAGTLEHISLPCLQRKEKFLYAVPRERIDFLRYTLKEGKRSEAMFSILKGSSTRSILVSTNRE